MIMNYRRISYFSSSIPKPVLSEETKVVPGLSYTPSQMLSMNEAQIAVSSFGLEFVDGTIDTYANHSEVPLERVHGVDVVDVWETQQDARYKFIKARKLDESLNSDKS